jgi:hypothetical protein
LIATTAVITAAAVCAEAAGAACGWLPALTRAAMARWI